jgi:hypothetical protein
MVAKAKHRKHRADSHRTRGNIMTTVELPADLHERARIFAFKRKTTLRALLEQGLRDVLRREDVKTR